MNKAAILSADGVYRYRLTREWSHVHPPLAWIMLNPSTADAYVDDPTIKKCVKFAQSWGYGRIEVVNLFALRATDPAALLRVVDPVGPENDAWIEQVLDEALDVVCAWGTKSPAPWRAPHVLNMLKVQCIVPKALRVTKDGHPGHPLYIPDRTLPVPFA